MQAVLDEAQPMVRLLWRRETEGKVFDSPERKATLDRALRAGHRGDPRPLDPAPLRRGPQGDAARSSGAEARRGGRAAGGARAGALAAARARRRLPTASARASALAGGGAAPERHLCDAILAILALHPA